MEGGICDRNGAGHESVFMIPTDFSPARENLGNTGLIRSRRSTWVDPMDTTRVE